MKDKLLELCTMQAMLDEAIYSQNDIEYDNDKCWLALLDEIGELNHALKKEWCWWKKTCADVNSDEVLGELADCWHFALSIYNHQKTPSDINWEIAAYNAMSKCPRDYKRLVQNILADYHKFLLGLMLELTYTLGFTFDDIYNAYIDKNKVNYERLQSGY